MFEESPENERQRRRLAMQSARFVAEGHRARYVIPQFGGFAGTEMRQREDRRAQRHARRERAWLEHKRLEDERRRVSEWIRRENAADESVARRSEAHELSEPFDWKWVDRRIEARLREERAYFEDALAAQARTTNEVMAGIVRAVENVARSAAQGAKSSGDLATLTGAIQKLSETMAGNQRAILRAIRRASQSDGVSEPSHHPKENARVH
jgi:hypothetical protein